MNGQDDVESIADKIANFLSGLWGATTSGMRSTADAVVSDFERIKQGRLPDEAIRAIQQSLAAYNNPIGVVMPRIGAYQTYDKVFRDPRIGWEKINVQNYPSIDPLKSLVLGGAPGSIRDIVLRAIQAQEKTGMRP